MSQHPQKRADEGEASVFRRTFSSTAALPIAVAAFVLSILGPGIIGQAGAAIADLITGKDVKNNSLTSKDVKNGSLLARDFKAGQLPTGEPGPQGTTGPQGFVGPSGTQGVKGATGPTGTAGESSFVDVGAEWSINRRDLSGTTFTPVPSLATTVDVPTGKTATIVATFSATSACTGGAAGGKCMVRVVVDGTEMNPPSEDESVFDSVDDGNTLTHGEGHAVVRSLPGIGSGTHTVVVQAATSKADIADPFPTLSVWNNSLVAQAIEE